MDVAVAAAVVVVVVVLWLWLLLWWSWRSWWSWWSWFGHSCHTGESVLHSARVCQTHGVPATSSPRLPTTVGHRTRTMADTPKRSNPVPPFVGNNEHGWVGLGRVVVVVVAMVVVVVVAVTVTVIVIVIVVVVVVVVRTWDVNGRTLSCNNHGSCIKLGWQNALESDSWRPRHPEPSTTDGCWPSRAPPKKKPGLNSTKEHEGEPGKGRQYRRKHPSNAANRHTWSLARNENRTQTSLYDHRDIDNLVDERQLWNFIVICTVSTPHLPLHDNAR